MEYRSSPEYANVQRRGGGQKLNGGCGFFFFFKFLLLTEFDSVLTWYHALNLWEDQIIFKLIDLKIDRFKARQSLGH